jgi:signal peptidase II
MMTVRIKHVVLTIVTLVTIGCDQATKHLAARHLANGRRSYLNDTIRTEYVENAGAFLGLGANWPAPARQALFTVGTGLLLATMAAVYLKSARTRAQLLGIGLLWAGGLSNLIDRVRYGHVPDFLNVGIGSLRTGIFNVADMVILVGFVLLLVDQVRSHDEAREEEP